MLGGMAPVQRPLRPVRTERKPVTIQDLSGQEVVLHPLSCPSPPFQVKLLLCVVRAYDVPVRQDSDPVAAREGGREAAGPRESTVNSFVEATFQVFNFTREGLQNLNCKCTIFPALLCVTQSSILSVAPLPPYPRAVR